jgi:hypothetical protein
MDEEEKQVTKALGNFATMLIIGYINLCTFSFAMCRWNIITFILWLIPWTMIKIIRSCHIPQHKIIWIFYPNWRVRTPNEANRYMALVTNINPTHIISLYLKVHHLTKPWILYYEIIKVHQILTHINEGPYSQSLMCLLKNKTFNNYLDCKFMH